MSSKNVVFMITANSENKKEYQYSVSSWKYFCEKNDAQLILLDKTIIDQSKMHIIFQRYYLFDMLENSDVDYDQVLMVDADTIVHPACPNFFDMTDDKYCMVHDDGSYDWILRGMEHYKKYLFKDEWFDFWEYGNGGFQIVNKNHKEFFKEMIKLYFENKELIDSLVDKFGIGRDQTILNFMLKRHNIDVKLLPYEYNMTCMPKKEIIGDDMLHTRIGHVMHFNGLPDKEKSVPVWMEATWRHLYGSLTNTKYKIDNDFQKSELSTLLKINPIHRKVIFRAKAKWGSSINRGEEISNHLKSLGYDTMYTEGVGVGNGGITYSLPNDTRDSTIVVLKDMHQDEFVMLKNNGNKIIIDVIDCIANGDYTMEQIYKWPFMDGLIVPTEQLAVEARILRPDLEVAVLYHHWDKKHLKNIEHYKNTEEYKFRLAYIGSPAGHFHKDQIENLTAVHEWEKMTSTSPYYTCHYSVRLENDPQFLYKPNTKISVAAAVGANVIHSRDLSLKNLLPDDYPYYTDTDLESVQKMAKYAEETFDSEIWHTGLEMMRELKERTSLERIAGVDYVKFLRKFN